MKLKGYQLEFICRIKSDGSGMQPLEIKDLEWLQDKEYNVNCLSISNKTYIASGFSSFIVKLKPQIPNQIINESNSKTILLDYKKDRISFEKTVERLNTLVIENEKRNAI